MSDGLASALNGADFAEPARVCQVAANAFNSGQLDRITIGDRATHTAVGVSALFLEAIATVAGNLVE
jgi:hypothetical protein